MHMLSSIWRHFHTAHQKQRFWQLCCKLAGVKGHVGPCTPLQGLRQGALQHIHKGLPQLAKAADDNRPHVSCRCSNSLCAVPCNMPLPLSTTSKNHMSVPRLVTACSILYQNTQSLCYLQHCCLTFPIQAFLQCNHLDTFQDGLQQEGNLSKGIWAYHCT